MTCKYLEEKEKNVVNKKIVKICKKKLKNIYKDNPLVTFN